MGEDGELEPGAVGPVVIGGDRVEGKLTLEFGEGLLLRAAASGEIPQGARGKCEIGRYRGVFEVTVVGGEQIELVILWAPMMNPLAIDHDPQLQSPDCQLKLGLEAIDIARDSCPARLGVFLVMQRGPPREGNL